MSKKRSKSSNKRYEAEIGDLLILRKGQPFAAQPGAMARIYSISKLYVGIKWIRNNLDKLQQDGSYPREAFRTYKDEIDSLNRFTNILDE